MLGKMTAHITTAENVSHFCNLTPQVSIYLFCTVIRNFHKKNILSHPLKDIIIVNIGAPPTEYQEHKFLYSCPLLMSLPSSHSPHHQPPEAQVRGAEKNSFARTTCFYLYLFHYFYFFLFPILLKKIFQPMQKFPLIESFLFTRGNQLIIG